MVKAAELLPGNTRWLLPMCRIWPRQTGRRASKHLEKHYAEGKADLATASVLPGVLCSRTGHTRSGHAAELAVPDELYASSVNRC